MDKSDISYLTANPVNFCNTPEVTTRVDKLLDFHSK
jgi:hypothetical protein